MAVCSGLSKNPECGALAWHRLGQNESDYAHKLSIDYVVVGALHKYTYVRPQKSSAGTVTRSSSYEQYKTKTAPDGCYSGQIH